MPESNLNDQLMDIEEFVPYRMWWVARQVGLGMQQFYKPEFGLNPAGWRALINIGSRKPLSSKQLGQFIGLDPVQTSRAVDELVRKRLVIRKTDRTDRRRVELSLSKKGLDVFASISTRARDLERELFEGFSRSELKTFSGLLGRLEQRVDSIIEA